MIYKLKYLLLFFMLIFLSPVFGLNNELLLLKNNKESVSTLVSKSKKNSLLKKYSRREINQIMALLEYSLNNLFEDQKKLERKICDLNYIDYILKILSHSEFELTPNNLEEVFYLARIENRIDDIFLQILLSLKQDYIAILEANDESREPWFRSRYSNLIWIRDLDLNEIFTPFNMWEENDGSCLYDAVRNLKLSIGKFLPKGRKVDSKILKKVFLNAYNQGILTLSGYKVLEHLRKNSSYIHSNPTLHEYFDVLFKVKDKMVSKSYEPEIISIELEDSFNSEQLKRLSKLSHRKKLYQKYNTTQIFMLSQVLEKASRRMGNDPDVITSLPVITQSFSVLGNEGERTNYVEKFELDPSSQYQYARKRLRMDLIDLQNMKTFAFVNIEYTDIITAALETGYITHEDIQTVIKYDDLWNQELPPFYRIKNFAYMLGRSSLLYLPPPWNITASIGLTAIESLINKNNVNGENNDNPTTLF